MIGLEGKTLRSPRLTFRLLQDCDKPYLLSIVGEPETALPAGFSPVSDRDAFEEFWQGLTMYRTGIAIVLEGNCIGYYHVNPYRPEEPEYMSLRNVSIGYLIGRDYTRQGYATEALQTLNPYLLERFDCIWADYFKENEASKALLAKCGFSEVGSYSMPFDCFGGAEKLLISNVLTVRR